MLGLNYVKKKSKKDFSNEVQTLVSRYIGLYEGYRNFQRKINKKKNRSSKFNKGYKLLKKQLVYFSTS
jgi:hypothetical protein